MSDDSDIPALATDSRLQLLSEALRAGPGSAEWAAAVVEAARVGTHSGLDEYAVLVQARERLADGRGYRSVRAGPGFGRRLMARVDATQVAARPRSPLSAGPFAYIGVALIVGVAGLLLALILRSTNGEGGSQQELARAYFPTTFASASLSGPLPPGWRPIGSLSLDPDDGLAVDPERPALAADTYAGGGLVTRAAVPADEPLAVQATFHFSPHVGPGCMPQLFVSRRRTVLARTAASAPTNWRGSYRTTRPRSRSPTATCPTPGSGSTGGDEIAVKVVVAADGTAAVVCNGQVLWTGASGLTDHPRYAGVRFLYRSPRRPAGRRHRPEPEGVAAVTAGIRPLDADHPADAEPIGQHAELRRPEHLGQRNVDPAAPRATGRTGLRPRPPCGPST